MRRYTGKDKAYNIIFSGLLVLILTMVLSLLFDFYFDINDDTVIRDILSGRYTGTPDGHTNQLLYPLGSLLALLYSGFRKLPIYSCFLSVSLMGSLWMIGYKCMAGFKSRRIKAVIFALLLLLFPALMVRELVLVQYTSVSGILCTAACFWFLTTAPQREGKYFFTGNIPVLAAYTVAFLLRSEMALLCLPMAGVSGLLCLLEEVERDKNTGGKEKKKRKEVLLQKKFGKYPAFLGILILIMGAMLLWDHLAYQSPEWKEFRQFFNARTRVYDYTWYPSYESNEDFYRENGISRAQQQLIDNYNFGLDEQIDKDMLVTIAEYNERGKHIGGISERLRTSLRELIRIPFELREIPYNLFVIAGYGLVALLAVGQGRKREYGSKLVLLLLARCVCWFYLVWSQRVVIRVSHPLYLLEFFILLSILIKELHERPLWNMEKYYRAGVGAILFLLSLGCLPIVVKELKQELTMREEALRQQQQLEDYFKENSDNYYYLDVYSMVSFTGRLYANTDNDKRNYDYLGGWICKSPLQEEAKKTHLSPADEKEDKQPAIDQLLLKENFYFVAKKDREINFITDYYREKGQQLQMRTDHELPAGNNPFVVYKPLIME